MKKLYEFDCFVLAEKASWDEYCLQWEYEKKYVGFTKQQILQFIKWRRETVEIRNIKECN